jgi:undecaprenyl-diphosphatase
MDSLITFVAEYLVIAPAVATLYLLWKLRAKKRRNLVFILVATGILSFILASVAGHLYYNPRPFINDGVTPLFSASSDNGFPSLHTLVAAFLGFAALTYSFRWGVALLMIAALIGWARVGGGVHHLVDVCGSFVITGVAYLIVSQPRVKPALKAKTKRSRT